MKRKGSKSDFSEERNAELRAAFFSQATYSTSDDALRRVIGKPSSRFWVDPDRARDVMSRMERDPESIAGMNPERRRMYSALYDRYRAVRSRNPSASKISCVSMAVFSGAPEFYITPSTARSIIYG